jgi:hypothetical protein
MAEFIQSTSHNRKMLSLNLHKYTFEKLIPPDFVACL